VGSGGTFNAYFNGVGGIYHGYAVGGTSVGYIGSGDQLYSGGAATVFGIDSAPSYGLTLGTANVERVRIDTSGNVGVANTTPIAKLDVNGTISASDAIQVGASTLTCGSSISGSVRWGTASNTLQ